METLKDSNRETVVKAIEEMKDYASSSIWSKTANEITSKTSYYEFVDESHIKEYQDKALAFSRFSESIFSDTPYDKAIEQLTETYSVDEFKDWVWHVLELSPIMNIENEMGFITHMRLFYQLLEQVEK